MKRFILLKLLIIAAISLTDAQTIERKRFVEIPFDYENNFIILNVKFNKSLPLKFIFDTGAEYTILTKREFSDLMGIQYDRSFRIIGADLKTELVAYLATRIHLQIANYVAASESILVLDEDYFKFEELTGIEVHGLIGASLFSKYIVRINYQKRVITLYDPQYFSGPSNKFTAIPIEVSRNKPYLNARSFNTLNDQGTDVKLLLDTGASLSLLLHTDSTTGVYIPPNVIHGNIGMGLGGYLEGYIGRVHQLDFGGFNMKGVVSNFQAVQNLRDTLHLNKRNGILGNLILDRFEVIIDYTKEMLYLKPNRKYKEKFKYDRSGIILVAGGKNLNTFTVNEVIEGSPADLAGVKVGDVIKKVNWIPSGYMSMKDITSIFMKKEGKRIKLKLKRDGQKLKVVFHLRELF